MSTSPHRERIFGYPHHEALFDARLEAIAEEPAGRGEDVVLDIQRLTLHNAPEIRLIDGRPHERALGEYVPARLRFFRAEWLRRTGDYEQLDALPPDASARQIVRILHSRQARMGEFYWVMTGATTPSELILRARGCELEARPGHARRVEVIRRCTPAPISPRGLMPHRPALYARYAGDPIRIRLGSRIYRHRLFVGGLHHQREQRPDMDYVLNVTEDASIWSRHSMRHPGDRHAPKGEMAIGMDAADLLLEAGWVAERLRAGKRVLVHCYAGVNRSCTICCATLMLLEGVSADEALARVRELHPIASPDPYYWLLLRWLASPEGRPWLSDSAAQAATAHPAPPLRDALAVG
jgi:Dual specificity phosphatase, catalytic domain